MRASNSSLVYASTVSFTGSPTLTSETDCSGTVSSSRSGSTRTTVATLRAARDVVADADHALRDQAREWRAHTGVGDRLAREGDAGVRRLERAVRLLRRVQRNLILLPRRFDLGPSLIELALRDDLLIEQRTDAVELRLRPIERCLGVHDVGHLLRLERLAGREAEPRLDLRGIGFRLLKLRGCLGRGDAGQERALLNSRASLDRNLDHAADGLSAHLGLFVGGQ